MDSKFIFEFFDLLEMHSLILLLKLLGALILDETFTFSVNSEFRRISQVKKK